MLAKYSWHSAILPVFIAVNILLVIDLKPGGVFVQAAATFASVAPRAATTHYITIGYDSNLIYEPAFITADVGDVVHFEVAARNHTVTQSTLEVPCTPLEGGFTSGLYVFDRRYSNGKSYEITVNNTDPIWIHCEQIDACEKGMVFAVNPGSEGSGQDYYTFLERALSTSTLTTTVLPNATNYVTPSPLPYATATTVVDLGVEKWTTTWTSYEGSVDPTPATVAQWHTIYVGLDDSATFEPPTLFVKPWDGIIFEFHGKNDSVTQSAFLNPCTSAEHGFNFVQPNTSAVRTTETVSDSNYTTYTLVVNDTAPIFGFSSREGACAQGMVFAINSVETSINNFTAFQTLAIRSGGHSTGLGDDSADPTSNAGNSCHLHPATYPYYLLILASVVSGLWLATVF
ncbi:hypothetical protein FISHEDRAFT_36092 [Fistulina hepatica ATCC 64428]|uniref:Cupredoxin n=1 Tax=Fistulina hepatica ATCC 64428 TaxID=1128425 RepID=A0A0D7AK38_9AGAR|nr:hypothetical protein FISHEDRAFT_36092 [Fistulina hepatica ATCC 64428]